jgi:hypothetical protein
VSLRQCHILVWYAQGYEDQQVAAWLKTTPEAVRVARHATYRGHWVQFCPPIRLAQAARVPHVITPREHKFFGHG